MKPAFLMWCHRCWHPGFSLYLKLTTWTGRLGLEFVRRKHLPDRGKCFLFKENVGFVVEKGGKKKKCGSTLWCWQGEILFNCLHIGLLYTDHSNLILKHVMIYTDITSGSSRFKDPAGHSAALRCTKVPVGEWNDPEVHAIQMLEWLYYLGRLSTVNSLPWSRNQFEMIWVT